MLAPTVILFALLLQPSPDAVPTAPETLADLLTQPTWWAEDGRDALDDAVKEQRWADAGRLAQDLRKNAKGEDAARLAFVEARARLELGTPKDLAAAAALFEGVAQGVTDLQPRAWWGAARCRLGRDETAAYLEALARIPREDPVLGARAFRERCLALAAAQPNDDPAADCLAILDTQRERPDPGKPLTLDERLEKSERLYGAYRYTAALYQVRKALDLKPKTGSGPWCRATLQGGRILSRQREETKSLHWFDQYFKECEPPPGIVQAEALFIAGRSAFKAGEDDRCRRWLGRLADDHPDSRYADDALILVARLALRTDDPAAARPHLERLVKGIGNGDMAAEGAWLLTRILWEDRSYDDLIAWVDATAPAFGGNTDYRSQGRLLYWRARALQRKKNHQEAGQGFGRIVCLYPFSWYGLLSLERLEAWKKGKAAAAMAACDAVDGPTPIPGPGAIAAAPLLEDTALLRGLALRRMGFTDWAREAWRRVDDDHLLMAKAALLHGIGAHIDSHDIIRRKLPRILLQPPTGDVRFWWEVAYPRPFLPVVERHAKVHQLDPWLVYGIMREESGFNPRAESYAHALGLMQLLEKTARWMAEDTKIRVSRRRLRRPDTNVALGTQFLRYLFDGLRHPALAVAGYNCGKGGINRVRRRVRTSRLDEFIEAIPYDQTRRYTKRVLSSAAIYRHLHWGGWRPGSVSLKVPRIQRGNEVGPSGLIEKIRSRAPSRTLLFPPR